jgi:hypothetical protein
MISCEKEEDSTFVTPTTSSNSIDTESNEVSSFQQLREFIKRHPNQIVYFRAEGEKITFELTGETFNWETSLAEQCEHYHCGTYPNMSTAQHYWNKIRDEELGGCAIGEMIEGPNGIVYMWMDSCPPS